MNVTLLADSGLLALTSIPTGRQEVGDAAYHRAWLDLTDMRTCRISVAMHSPYYLGGSIFCEYSADGGSTWNPIVTSSGACVGLASAGTKRSGWNTMVTGSKADVLIRPAMRVDSSSSGSVSFGLIIIQFRTSTSTTSTGDDGALDP